MNIQDINTLDGILLHDADLLWEQYYTQGNSMVAHGMTANAATMQSRWDVKPLAREAMMLIGTEVNRLYADSNLFHNMEEIKILPKELAKWMGFMVSSKIHRFFWKPAEENPLGITVEKWSAPSYHYRNFQQMWRIKGVGWEIYAVEMVNGYNEKAIALVPWQNTLIRYQGGTIMRNMCFYELRGSMDRFVEDFMFLKLSH